jgi:hypothetical protein
MTCLYSTPAMTYTSGNWNTLCTGQSDDFFTYYFTRRVVANLNLERADFHNGGQMSLNGCKQVWNLLIWPSHGSPGQQVWTAAYGLNQYRQVSCPDSATTLTVFAFCKSQATWWNCIKGGLTQHVSPYVKWLLTLLSPLFA